MHTDEGKRFDKRNIENNLRKGIMTKKDYEGFLTKLPDVSDKIYNPDDRATEDREIHEGKKTPGAVSKKKGNKGRDK